MKFRLLIFSLLIVNFYYSFSQNQSANELREFVNTKNFEQAYQMVEKAIKENQENQSVLLLAGDVYVEMDKNDKALEVYKKAYELDKKNFEALNKYGKMLTVNGKHNEAITYFQDAVKKFPKDMNVRLNLANAYLGTDSLNKAELIITQARELDTKSPDAFIALGDLYQKQRVYELARMNFEEALAINPNNVDARVKLAIAYFRLANQETDEDLRSELYNRSLDEWNKITQQDPQNARAFYEQGRLLFFGGQYPNAAKSLNNFILLRPSGSLGRWYLAQSLEKIGACDSAIKHLQIVANEIDTVKKQANYLTALCMFDTKQYKQAIELFNKVSMDTNLTVIDMQRLGQAYLITGDTLNALASWEKAVTAGPEESCKIMNQMGILYQKLQLYDKSISILNRRIESAPCKDEYQHIVYYYLGLAFVQSAKPELAIEPFNKSIEANPEFLFSRISLADAYAATQKFELADSIFKSTIQIALKDTAKNSFVLTQSYSKLAGLYLDKKKFADVAKIAEEWSKLSENEPYAYLYAAIAYHNLSNGKQACINYRKVLKIDPKNSTAIKNLKALEDGGQCQ
jgi:tetratricopeptide (TPR) repeat protein